MGGRWRSYQPWNRRRVFAPSSELHRLTPGLPPARTIWSATAGDSIQPFQWSHDDKRIAVLIEREDRTSQLGVLGVDGSLRILTSLGWRGADRAVFSPDSRYLASAPPSPTEPGMNRSASSPPTQSREIVALEDRKLQHGHGMVGRRSTSASLRATEAARSLWAVPLRDSKPDGPPFVVQDRAGLDVVAGPHAVGRDVPVETIWRGIRRGDVA